MIKVLIVEDEQLVRKGIILGIDWSSLGCIVVAGASNGLEGIEAVDKYNPDLIITDIRMPKMDGIEMIYSLREQKKNMAVIFLTAYGDFTYAQKAIKLFASDYILKPFEDGELEEAVLRVKEEILSKTNETLQVKEVDIKLKGGKKSKYVLEAIGYITENYSNYNMSIDAIAESIGISGGHLSRTFKKETGHTILSYITLYRIHQGIILLVDCRYKVYEVADQIGYRDVTYFSSIFKKIVGVSPSEYQTITQK